jgi:hypothetical protein
MPFLAPLGAAAAGAAANPITPYLLSGASAAMSGVGRKSTPGSGGSLIQVNPYPYAQKLDQTAADFFAGNYARLGQGQAPAYIDRGLKISRDNMRKGLDETVYGYAGNRSVGSINAAMQAGALAGTGARPALSGVSKVLHDYSVAAGNIDAEIEKMRMDSINTAIGQGTQAIAAIPHFPQSYMTQGYGAQQTEGIAPYLSQMAGMMGYSQSMNSMNNTVNNAGAYATPYTNMTSAQYSQQPGYAQNAGNQNGGYFNPSDFNSYTSAAAPKSSSGSSAPWSMPNVNWSTPMNTIQNFMNPMQTATSYGMNMGASIAPGIGQGLSEFYKMLMSQWGGQK